MDRKQQPLRACDHSATAQLAQPSWRRLACVYGTVLAATVGCAASGPSLADRGTRLTAGISFSCALQSDGVVQCWGSNTHGQLGGGTIRLRPTAAAVPVVTDAVQIASGTHVTCATRESGAVTCWGLPDEGYGHARDESYDPAAAAPRRIAGIDDAVRVEVSSSELCAIQSDSHAVVCRSLGERDGPLSAIPDSAGLQQLSLARFGVTHAEVLCGPNRHCLRPLRMCALWPGGTARCLVDDRVAPMGEARSNAPRRATWHQLPVQDAVDVQLGYGTVCATTKGGAVACWGVRDGMFPDAPEYRTAREQEGLIKKPFTDAALVAVGGEAGCAWHRNGRMSCWDIEEGPDHTIACEVQRCPWRFQLHDVDPIADVVELAAGWSHACALTSQDDVYCWGENESGQLGTGSTSKNTVWSTKPRKVSFGHPR